jgi:hypothetical protein
MLARAGIEDFATVPFTVGRGVRLAAVVEQQLGGFTADLMRADHAGVIRRISICIADSRGYASLRRAVTRAMPALRSRGRLLVVDECAPPDTTTATPVSR